MKVETREVLAGAYKGGMRTLLRHAVEVDAHQIAVRVLCRRVELDSLADRGASDPAAPPTCPICVKRVRSAQAGKGDA